RAVSKAARTREALVIGRASRARASLTFLGIQRMPGRKVLCRSPFEEKGRCSAGTCGALKRAGRCTKVPGPQSGSHSMMCVRQITSHDIPNSRATKLRSAHVGNSQELRKSQKKALTQNRVAARTHDNVSGPVY